MQMRSGQKLIRPGLGERATRLLRILHVKPYGGPWDTGRLATGHCGLQYPHLAAVKAGPFHHSAITKRPWHVAKCTLPAARRPPLAVCSRTGLNLVGPVITLPAWPDTVPSRNASRGAEVLTADAGVTPNSVEFYSRPRQESSRFAGRTAARAGRTPFTSNEGMEWWQATQASGLPHIAATVDTAHMPSQE